VNADQVTRDIIMGDSNGDSDSDWDDDAAADGRLF
jgi:hypothetical protein